MSKNIKYLANLIKLKRNLYNASNPIQFTECIEKDIFHKFIDRNSYSTIIHSNISQKNLNDMTKKLEQNGWKVSIDYGQLGLNDFRYLNVNYNENKKHFSTLIDQANKLCIP